MCEISQSLVRHRRHSLRGDVEIMPYRIVFNHFVPGPESGGPQSDCIVVCKKWFFILFNCVVFQLQGQTRWLVCRVGEGDEGTWSVGLLRQTPGSGAETREAASVPLMAGSQYGTCYLRGGDMRMSPHFFIASCRPVPIKRPPTGGLEYGTSHGRYQAMPASNRLQLRLPARKPSRRLRYSNCSLNLS